MPDEMRIAIVKNETGLVVNVGIGPVGTPHDGMTYIESETANIGDSWDGTNIVPAPQPETARE